MSVRLFHRGARLVIRWSQPSPDRVVWCAMHRRPVPWGQVFRPTLRLLGFATDEAVAGLRFGTGSLDWTGGPFWTTLRLQLPAVFRQEGGAAGRRASQSRTVRGRIGGIERSRMRR